MNEIVRDEAAVLAVGREIVGWFVTAALDRARWAPDAEVDAWQPVTRIQAAGVDAVEAAYRAGYPTGQEVTWWSAVATERGVLVELTTRSRDAEHRFAKMCIVVETDAAGLIARARVHCTGEWPAALEQAFLARGGSLTP